MTSESNASGNCNFPIPASGQYELVCEFEGFKTYIQSGFVREMGTVRGVNIEMQVGAVARLARGRWKCPPGNTRPH